MNKPPIQLPVSAYIMAGVSAVFVFFGACFALGAGLAMVLLSWNIVRWSVIAAPLILITSATLAFFSAMQTLQQARRKLAVLSSADLQVTCEGCGEDVSAKAPVCPVCGRKVIIVDAIS